MAVPRSKKKVARKVAKKTTTNRKKTAKKRAAAAKKKVAAKKAVNKNSRAQREARAKRGAKSESSTRHKESSSKRKTRQSPLLPVHCALAPMPDSALLLPTSAIAAVVDYAEPAPMSSTPQWFLGQVEWENRQIPVFNYLALISGTEPDKASSKDRIMIVKSLADSARVPYLGILIKDIPKLISVKLDHIEHISDDKKALGAFCHVEIEDQAAIIPDIDRLTHLVTHAAYGILPITEVRH